MKFLFFLLIIYGIYRYWKSRTALPPTGEKYPEEEYIEYEEIKDVDVED